MSTSGTILLSHVPSRRAAGSTSSLDGTWNAIPDPYDVGGFSLLGGAKDGWFRDRKPRHPAERIEYDFDTSMELEVPGDWNTQVPELHYYEGSLWYRRRFTTTVDEAGRTLLYFGAVNHSCTIYLDGDELATHEGGYGPFAVEVTGRVGPGDHSLVVLVDCLRKPERVPAMRTDWFNFGGLHRSVDLVTVPDEFITSAWVTMAADGSLVGEVNVDGNGAPTASIEIAELGIDLEVDVNEHFRVPVGDVPELERWHPGRPRRYEVTFTAGIDRVVEEVGFRTVETRGSDVVVNGEVVFLKGISMHAEGPSGGRRASGPEDAATLFDWAEELGANFVRLAHYQHDEAMVMEADRRGLLVWVELPVYWGIDWTNDDTLANTLQQTDELVLRDRCRASVILWSVANETFPGDDRTAFIARLIERVRALDTTRLVTCALFTLPAQGIETHIDDPLGDLIDVIGVNQYYGWYYGERDEISTKRWTSEWGKPIIFSELGAGAKYGHHGDDGEIWTEEFQAAVYDAQIDMIAANDDCAGLSPWILKDFRTPMRVLPGIQDGYNRKGLVSEEGERKLAFDVLRRWYRSLS
ncbi:MAG: glycoside hydrolase family 2 TIM barrel-domain containing protein [Actinomycetota bacterium]